MYFPPRVFGTSMVEEYEEIADPSERPDDPDDDLGKTWQHFVFTVSALIFPPFINSYKITWRSLYFKLCTMLLNNVRELNNEVVQSTQALCLNSMRQIYTTYHTDVQYMLMTPPPTDYPAGYASGEAKSSNNLIGSAKGNFAYASVDVFENEVTAQPVATQHSAVCFLCRCHLEHGEQHCCQCPGWRGARDARCERCSERVVLINYVNILFCLTVSGWFAFHLSTVLHLCLAGNVSSQQVNATEPSTQLETTGQTTAPHLPPVWVSTAQTITIESIVMKAQLSVHQMSCWVECNVPILNSQVWVCRLECVYSC